MRTDKQKRSSHRSFMLMSIVGMITMIRMFRQYYTTDLTIRNRLIQIEFYLEGLRNHIQYLKDRLPNSYLNSFTANYQDHEHKESNT